MTTAQVAASARATRFAQPELGSRFETLDGLRGLGAVCVMLLHFGSVLGISPPAHGYLAVDLFFCLSGFVLSRSYSAKIASGMPFNRWMLIRLIRLYPLYLLSIFLGGVAANFTGMPGSSLSTGAYVTAFATGLLMLPSPTWSQTPEMFPLNFVAWSLSIELMLSLLFFWASTWRTRTLLCLLGLGLVGLALVRWRIGYVGGGFAWRDAPTGLARGLYGFSAGMLMARTTLFGRRKSQMSLLPVLAAAILFWVTPSHGVAYDLVAIVFFVPLIAFVATRIEPANGVIYRSLGDVSYAVYALHIVSLSTFELVTNASTDHPLRLWGPAVISIFILLCAFLDRYFDRPIRATYSARLRTRVVRATAP